MTFSSSDSVLAFYEQLASRYHLIFPDWPATVLHQAEVLDQLIRQFQFHWPLSLLDCSCGIGTQAIGLALRGYSVHATDLSPAAIEQAKIAATRFNAELTWGVADMRSLTQTVVGCFDVVITCDNAIPHLLTDADLRLAADNLFAKLKPEGLLLASIRDYDQLLEQKPRSTLPHVIDDAEDKRIVFQVWDWLPEGNRYQIHHFMVREAEAGWQTQHCSTHYRALRRNELSQILQAAGFAAITWLMPKQSGYYQPIVIARKP